MLVQVTPSGEVWIWNAVADAVSQVSTTWQTLCVEPRSTWSHCGSENCEDQRVPAAAGRALALLLGHGVTHLAGERLLQFESGPLAPLLERSLSLGGNLLLGLLASQLLAHRRQPLGFPAEHVPLQGGHLRLQCGEPLAQLLGLFSPGAEMV